MVEIEVDEKMLEYIKNKLGAAEKQAPSVLKKAINSTAKSGRKLLAEKAREEYAIKNRDFNREMKIKNATNGRLEAIIKSDGKVLEIKEYKATPLTYVPGGNNGSIVKGKVLKKSSPKTLEVGATKAFVAKFKSGHISVVQRVPGKKMESNPEKTFLKKLLSPSIPKILGNEKRVYGIVEPKIQTELRDSVNKYIESILEG